jgi:hypothetical protein
MPHSANLKFVADIPLFFSSLGQGITVTRLDFVVCK